MWNIPADVIAEILVRLPAECVFRLRGVCQAWRCMIDNPSFIKAHTQNHGDTHNHNHNLNLLIKKKKKTETGDPLYSLSLDSINFTNGPQIILCKQLIHNRVPFLKNLREMAFCNGLILLTTTNIDIGGAICNPLTGEWRELPHPGDGWILVGPNVYRNGYGFGYDMDADDYKVVNIIENRGRRWEDRLTLIYSLKLNSWRKIAESPRIQCWSRATYLDGKLYWISFEEYRIVALHLGTETYSYILLPDAVALRYRIPYYAYSLVASDGCLILSEINYLSGWVMKDEGSWIQLYSSMDRYIYRNYKDLRVVAYLKSKRQVILKLQPRHLQHEELSFLLLDIDNNHSFKKFTIHGFPNIGSFQSCPGSFQSCPAWSLVRLNININTGGGGGNAGQTKMRDARLRLCVRDGEQCCLEENRQGTRKRKS